MFAAAMCAAGASRAHAQLAAVSRADAVASAVAHGARFALARADTSVAAAQLRAARMFQNPALAWSYSKSTPQQHFALELPLEIFGQRGARVGSANSARGAAQFRFAFEQAAARLEADTTYTRVLAARERHRLSARNAEDADSLRRMAAVRRDAGDASDLDVELAAVSAGQVANIAAADSLSYLSSLLDLQAVMGLTADRVAITPTDTLIAPPSDAAVDSTLADGAAPLQVEAARASLESARLLASMERRNIFGSPAISVGFETGDPTGAEPGTLPTFGISLPIPLLNQNRGPIALAQAEQERARAELALTEALTKADIARTRREYTIALTKVDRDRALVVSATRVATMSLTAYREGAASLPNVLEAQRSAREVQSQYVDDLASLLIAAAELRVLTLTASSARAP